MFCTWIMSRFYSVITVGCPVVTLSNITWHYRHSAVAEVEFRPEFLPTNDTTCISLAGELRGVFREELGDNWPSYNGTALHNISIQGYTLSYILNPFCILSDLSKWAQILDGETILGGSVYFSNQSLILVYCYACWLLGPSNWFSFGAQPLIWIAWDYHS